MSKDNRSTLVPILQNVSASEARAVWEALTMWVEAEQARSADGKGVSPFLVQGRLLLERMQEAAFGGNRA